MEIPRADLKMEGRTGRDHVGLVLRRVNRAFRADSAMRRGVAVGIIGTSVAALPLLMLSGCSTGLLPAGSDASLSEPFALLDPTAAPDQSEQGLNETFQSAETLDLTIGHTYTIEGAFDSADDVDVYDGGAMSAGDRMVAELVTDSGVEGAIALFDGAGDSLLISDTATAYKGRRGPYIDLVLRNDAEHAYLAVALTPGTQTIGNYTLAVQRIRANRAPAPTPQTILLNFDGATGIGLAGENNGAVPPFDAADISPAFEGLTDPIVERLVSEVRADYVGLNVRILSTSEGAVDDGLMSRIHFGTYDAALLGVAQNVDEYNAETRQDAVVFTDTFSVFNALEPSPEQIAQALANVASHEIGHLLGLVHTADHADIMDITASLSQLLDDQAFKEADIHPSVFILGKQDAPDYLVDSVGGDASALKQAAVSARIFRAFRTPVIVPDGVDDSRQGLTFSSCGPVGASHAR